MNNKEAIISLIKTGALLPLYFHRDPAVCVSILKALHDAGIRAVEFTNRGDEALENFAQLKLIRDKTMPDLKLGIGTIKNIRDAKRFIDAGTDFIVCPGFVKEVMHAAEEAELLCIPGCMTPTEIILAEQCGATFIKIFPGSVVGPSYINALREIFPKICFMPTGGVDLNKENIETWFKAGVSAVGMGSRLFAKQDIASGNFENITQKTTMILKWITEIRSSLPSN